MNSAPAPRPPLREDPLSMLMLAAVALLALMYWLDARQVATLDAAQQRALAVALPPALSACQAGAVGLDGLGWQLTCPALPLEVMLSAARGLAPAGAAQLILRGQDGVLICPLAAQPGWPDSCARHPLKQRTFYEEAARRRPRETQ
jgi:hypothetical protein